MVTIQDAAKVLEDLATVAERNGLVNVKVKWSGIEVEFERLPLGGETPPLVVPETTQENEYIAAQKRLRADDYGGREKGKK